MAANALLRRLLMLLLLVTLSAYSLPTTTSDDDTQEEVVTFPPSYWGDPAPNAYLQALTPYSTVWNSEPNTEPKTEDYVREEEENPVDSQESTIANTAGAADKKQAIRTRTATVRDTKKQRKHIRVGKNSTAQQRTKNIKKFPSNTTITVATATADAATTTTAATVAAVAAATSGENADETKKGTDVNSHVFASLKELENDVTEFRDAMGSVAENVIEDRLDNTNDKGEGVLARRSNRIKEAMLRSRLRKEKFENQLLDFFTNYLCNVDCKK